MKGMLITLIGGEDAAKSEIKDLINGNATKRKGYVIFEFDKWEQMFKLCFLSQSANRIILLDDPLNWLSESTSFRVRATDKSKEIEVAEKINQDSKFKVDLKNPDIPVYHHDGHTGIDFTFDISKRSFRIFTNRITLKGTAAFILLKEAGYDKDKVLLDCYAKDGTIAIEAAHYLENKSVRHFDWEDFPFLNYKKFENFDFDNFFDSFKSKKKIKDIFATTSDLQEIHAIKKNAKIAGISSLKISRMDIEWLDSKFEEESADMIVSYLPQFNKKQSEEFFHQAEFITKRIAVLTKPENKRIFEDVKFNIIKEKEVEIGKIRMLILVLDKINS